MSALVLFFSLYLFFLDHLILMNDEPITSGTVDVTVEIGLFILF